MVDGVIHDRLAAGPNSALDAVLAKDLAWPQWFVVTHEIRGELAGWLLQERPAPWVTANERQHFPFQFVIAFRCRPDEVLAVWGHLF